MGIKTVPHPPYSPDLRGCYYQTIKEMKEAVMKVIDTLTRELPWGLPEVAGMVQQVHCSQRRLLQRGLEFMCVLSIKAPIRKKSGNLFNDPRVYIYIYIYIYMRVCVCVVMKGK